MEKTYETWFKFVVETGWTCGLYHPVEILANYLMHYVGLQPYDEPFEYEYVEQYMIDTVQSDLMLSNKPSLKESVQRFNKFYKDNRMDFSLYVRKDKI